MKSYAVELLKITAAWLVIFALDAAIVIVVATYIMSTHDKNDIVARQTLADHITRQ